MAIHQSIQATVTTLSNGLTALLELVEAHESFTTNMVAAVELIANSRGRLIVTGLGKSGHIGRKIAATMASTGTPAYFIHPTEAGHGDLGMIGKEDTILALSWSGETAELHSILAYAKRFKVPLISVTSNGGSLLARNATVAINLPKVEEACPHGLAPTSSTLLQLAVGDALAIALLEKRNFSATNFKTFHPGGKLGAQLKLIEELAHAGDRMPLVQTGVDMGTVILKMSEKGFGVVGVVDTEERLIGVVTDGDLRRNMSASLLQAKVDTVMSRKPKTVSPDALASAALHTMESQKITVLFIVDDKGRVNGIVHILDLLRAGVA